MRTLAELREAGRIEEACVINVQEVRPRFAKLAQRANAGCRVARIRHSADDYIEDRRCVGHRTCVRAHRVLGVRDGHDTGAAD